MSNPQRRELLTAAGIASLAATQPATGGDPSFMNNVPDPTLAGKDLPTFKNSRIGMCSSPARTGPDNGWSPGPHQDVDDLTARSCLRGVA